MWHSTPCLCPYVLEGSGCVQFACSHLPPIGPLWPAPLHTSWNLCLIGTDGVVATSKRILSKTSNRLCTLIQNPPKELVPPDPNAMWTTFGQGAVCRKIQKALCALIDDRVCSVWRGS